MNETSKNCKSLSRVTILSQNSVLLSSPSVNHVIFVMAVGEVSFSCTWRKIEQRNLVQRCALKFCVELRESANVTFEKVKQSYGNHSSFRAQFFHWHKSFSEGMNEHRSRSSSTSKTEENIEPVYSCGMRP